MMNDFPDTIYHFSFKDVLKEAGDFLTTVYVFQSEEFNSIWQGFFQPDVDRIRMGPGTGLISLDKTHQQGHSYVRVNFYDLYSNCIWELDGSVQCHNTFTQSFGDDSVNILTDSGVFLKYRHRQLETKIDFQLSTINSIMNACIWSDGFAAILTNGDLIYSTDLQQYQLLKHFDSIGCPSSFEAIPPKRSKTGSVIVYFIYDDKLYVISDSKSYILKFNEKIINFAFSFNYSKIAILTDDSNLHDPSVRPTYEVIVSTIDIQAVIYKKIVQNETYNRVINIGWIGDVAPIVCFQGAFYFITPDEGPMTMCALHDPTDDSFCLTDVDSCVILTSGQNYRIRHVPLNVYYIFCEEQTRPDIPIVYRDLENTLSLQCDKNDKWNYARLLSIAYDERNETPPITSFGKIGPNDIKISAANDCLLAASYFHNPMIQEFFLNAACYILTLMKQTNSIADAILRVKILNKVRNEAKLPMTTRQIYHIGVNNLLHRLMSRGRMINNNEQINFHKVAFEIADMLHKKGDEIQRDFIQQTILNNYDDDTCYELIKSTIDSRSSMAECGYLFAVRYAISQGRNELASRLCLLEQQYSNRAEMFAQLGQWDQAIKFAYESYDINAMITVLDYCKTVDNEASILKINENIALYETPAMFITYCPTFFGLERTIKILRQIDPKSTFCDALQRVMISIPDSPIPSSLETALEPQSKLRECQKSIAQAMNNPQILTMSYNNTIRYLINNSPDLKDALQLADKTKNPRINVAVMAIHEFIQSHKLFALKSCLIVKEFSSIWPLVVDLLIKNGHKEFAREFALEVSAKFKHSNLIQLIEDNAFDIAALHSKESYQKFFFRQKGFFKIRY